MQQLDDIQYSQCQKAFLALGEMSLKLNHYQLARETNIEDPMIWKTFLTDPRSVEFISSEMDLIRQATINEIIQHAGDSKSVGQAQLINSLAKLDETAQTKEGPAFIFCYVPLNTEQKFAPNIQTVTEEGVLPNDNGWNLNEEILDSQDIPKN